MSEPQSITRSYWIHALTPLHVGSGRGVGFIDLPIMREVVTKWPLVPGSAVKGVLHDFHSNDDLKQLAFGTSGVDYSSSGSLVFTDARIVCLPVRSLFGTFAWCTSPLALERLRRDLGTASPGELRVGEGAMLVPDDPASVLCNQGKAFFEDLDFEARVDGVAARWAETIAKSAFGEGDAWNTLFRQRFAVVHDDIFNFLAETATQVDARVRIDDDTRTVVEGGLWYEESLPAEALLAGLVWCGPVFGRNGRDTNELRNELIKRFCTDAVQLQLGGKATTGRGQVRLVFSGRSS